MKNKLLIIWFILIFVSGDCGVKHEKHDPLQNAHIYKTNIITKYYIKKDLDYFLNKYNRHWTKQEKETCTNCLYSGYNEWHIDPKIILAIISVESEFNIRAIGKNKRSIDYGLTQINSRYIKQRYKATESYLKYYKIKYSNNNFDLSKNIFSCFMYLKDLSDTPELIQFGDYIKAYNCGVRGYKCSKYQRQANNYYNKFMKNYMEI